MEAGRRPSRPCPWHNASLLSTLVFGWTWSLFRDGYQKDYSSEDLYVPPSKDQSQILGDRLEKEWHQQVDVAARAKKTPSLKGAILRAFVVDYIKLGGLILVHGLLMGVVSPILLGQVLDYFEQPEQGKKLFAYWCASGIAVTSGINAVLFNHFTLGASRLGMRVRTACCSMLYRKALRLSQSASATTPVGQMVNLLSNDVSRFEKVSVVLHYLWLSPALSGIAAGFMFQEVGWPSVAGLAALVAVLPIQGYMSQLNAKYRSQTAYRSDARIRLIDDVVSGIRAIKMYTWEIPFQYLVRIARRKELEVLTLASYIRGIYMTLTLCSTRTAFFCSLVTMAILHERLTARKVFVLQSYFNVLSDAISMNLVRGMAEVAEVFVSIARLQDFMLLQEVADRSPKKISLLLRSSPGKQSPRFEEISSREVKPTYAVMMKGLTATWDPQYTAATLNNINICIKEGYLSAVVGAVGSGKSSLLQAVLGELPASQGGVLVRGAVSYASQEPWVFAASVRQNILFGQPFDRSRYDDVIRACVLDRDFARLPRGDLTEVGDQGIALSGGQKARINLARAIYKKADIYLLDDPLAALDSNVAQELFDKCICKFLEKKTRILVTNHLQYLQKPDLIVMMNDSRAVVVEGDFTNVAFLNSHKRRLASCSNESQDLQSPPPPEPLHAEEDGGEDKIEVSSKGRIQGKSVVREYLSSGSNLYLNVLILLLFLITQLLVSAVDYFVSLWTTQEELKERNNFKEHNERKTFQFDRNSTLNSSPEESVVLDLQLSVIIYSTLIIALFFFALVRSLIFFKVCMICSTKLHGTMFKSIIRAKVFFFDKNPTGRILNRFSKDMGAIDETLPRTLLNAKQALMQMLGCIIVSVIVNYFFLVPILLIGTIFWFSRHIYLTTSNNMKRIEGMTKSPVFNHFHATMRGLPTIRASGAQAILSLEFDHHQDLHTSAWFTFLATSTAFGFFLDFFVSLFIAVVTIGSLVLEGRIVGVFGGHPGLAITQSMSLSGMLQWGVRESAEVSNNLMSVERVVEYTCVQPEEEQEEEQEGSSTQREWPESGRIEFVNVSVTYNPTDPPVIRHVNLVITPGQKIGIVGRTGAGKSSLLSALFRLCSSMEGRILIDGVDTRAVPLEELRRRMSVIPQEPLMFAGTMRHNLDPFAQHPDSQLMKVLQEVELKHALHDTQGLNTKVAEGGRNFSAGQRQLLCLARAIIRESKILVMDEATANVDEATDTLIQKTIRIKFKHCTVLTVAHRLESVIDYDKILVIEAGEVVEFDHPHLLLQNPRGHFSKLVKENCANVANRLLSKARESYEKKGLR